MSDVPELQNAAAVGYGTGSKQLPLQTQWGWQWLLLWRLYFWTGGGNVLSDTGWKTIGWGWGGAVVPVEEGRGLRQEGMGRAVGGERLRGEGWEVGGEWRGSRTCLARLLTFFLFLRVAVALIFDEAGAGRASRAGYALQASLHQLAQLKARPWRHAVTVLTL